MDFFTALQVLSTFDHDACNTAIFDRHITLVISRLRDGGVGAYEPIPLLDIVLPLIFAIVVVNLGVWSYRNRKTMQRRSPWRNYYYIAPVVAALPLWLTVQGVRETIEYAQTCTRLVHGGT
jgi:hypothetical protein